MRKLVQKNACKTEKLAQLEKISTDGVTSVTIFFHLSVAGVLVVWCGWCLGGLTSPLLLPQVDLVTVLASEAYVLFYRKHSPGDLTHPTSRHSLAQVWRL